MTIKEKVSYLKGLAEGMEVDNNELGKLVTVLIDTISDMADEIEELNENSLDIAEELDELSDDLSDVELALEELTEELDYGGLSDFDDIFDYDYGDEDDDDDEDDEGYRCCDICGASEYSLDITCPECSAEIELDEADIENESVTCPDCKNEIELEIDVVETEERL